MKSKKAVLLLFSVTLILWSSCQQKEEGESTMEARQSAEIIKEPFGSMPDGQEVDLYTLSSAGGCKARITNFGGIVVTLEVPDRTGTISDVVLGFDDLEGYLGEHPHFGALIGRYGNRIGKAKFSLEGVEYELAANNGENHLHGGTKGYDKVLWQGEVTEDLDGPALLLRYLSSDGEEGYPGNLTVEVTYRWTDDCGFRIDYRATTDKTTVVNLTQHSYFNLADAGAGDVLGHDMMIAADRFTPVDAGLIPTGELRPVEATPMDFRQPMAIGARIEEEDEQLGFGGGYDHNWVLNNQDGSLALAARVYEPASGRVMEVVTTEPGLQFYTGNFLDGSNVGKGGVTYQRRSAFCLETQHYPDSPNQPDFPSTVLEPGEEYRTTTIYRFSIK
jgi:aldose 1-epimerase